MPKPRTSRAARVRLSRLSHSAIARSARLRIEQTVQVNDEVAHVRVVDARLSLRLPSRIGRGIVRIDTDEIDLRKVLEAHAREVRELSAKDEVKELTLRLSAHVRVPYGFERPQPPENLSLSWSARRRRRLRASRHGLDKARMQPSRPGEELAVHRFGS